jgi:hypothetical protein
MRLLRLHLATPLVTILLVLACQSSVDDKSTSGGAGGAAASTVATGKTSSASGDTSSSTGLPPPTMVCTSFVAGSDGGSELTLVDLGSGSEDLFAPFAAQQTVKMEWGFQGLQHFPFTPRAANVTTPTVGFAEIIPDSGDNRGLAQIVFPPCEDGWSEIVGYVMVLPMPAATSGTMRLTVGTCPADVGCDPSQPDYGFVEVLGTKEIHVDVLPPEGPQPGAGGSGGQFG